MFFPGTNLNAPIRMNYDNYDDGNVDKGGK